MIERLPLFPLHSVLFPGMPVQLQIFEPRYKQMLQECLAGNRSFGVVLIKRGVEAFGPIPEPYRFGCRALIQRLLPLDDDRTHLVAIGQERFRVTSILQDHPYLVGQVEYRALQADMDLDLRSISAIVTARLRRYMQMLNRSNPEKPIPIDLPTDPQILAYRACSLLQLPLEEKQTLLEMEDVGELLRMLGITLRRELALMPALLTEEITDGIGPFGLN
jgi:Lon protease-like protein